MILKKLPLLIVSAFFLAACTHTTTTPDNSTSVPGSESTATEEIMVGSESPSNTESSIKEINLTAKQWEWNPSTITVNQGDTVRLNITSVDVEHGFSISRYNINELLSPGKTVTVEFLADKTGEFSYSCSVVCGEGLGQMNGTLIVQ